MKSIPSQVIHDLWPVAKKPLLISLISFVSLMILIPLLTYVYFSRTLQSKEAIMNQNNSGITLLDRNNKPFFTFYEPKQKTFIPIDQIPIDFQHAVVASEDREFYTHRGFSFKGIARAFFANLSKQEIAQGGSTITQQLVKNALLNQRKSFLRKYQEVVLAEEIERRYTKSEIMEMYLNSVYFGEGAFGAQQAALTFFGKDSKNLTLAESSFLIGILPAPSALSPFSGDLDQAKARQKTVLSEMLQLHYITQAQEENALNQKLVFNEQKEFLNSTAPHFALMVKQALIDKYGEEYVTRSGFKVKTTLDLAWQEYAEKVVKNQVASLKYDRATNGAAIAIDPNNGEVKALVGSVDWYNKDFGKFNIITANRQPGSSFKPIIYTEAIQRRLITAATILEDKPTTFPGNYKPKDFDGKYRGNVTVRRALSNSLNIPAVLVMQRLGVSNGLETASRMGLTTLGDSPSNYGLSLVLGAGDVKLLELTNAYAAFAHSGMQYKPSMVLEIKDKLDNVIYTEKPTATQVQSPEASYIVSSILSDNNARQEEFGNALTISRPAAVKTGTTESFRDALTIGYTPQIVVGVWVGNNDNTPMDNIAGSLGAAPIWRQLMERFLAGSPVVNFTKPFGLREVTLCSVKTEKDGDQEKTTTVSYKEYFLPGTEPKDACITPTPEQTQTPTPGPTSSPTPQPSATPQPTPTIEPSPTLSPTPIISTTPIPTIITP